MSLQRLSAVRPGIAPVEAVTKAYRALYTPPDLCAKPRQAETIIVAVEIRLLGLANRT